MGDEHGGDPGFPLDPADLLPGLQPEPRVQIGQGFIQQQDPRHLHQSPCDGNSLLLAAGKLAGFTLQETIDLYKPRRLCRSLDHLFFGHLIFPFPVLKRKDDVLQHGKVRIKRIALENHADAPVFRRKIRHIVLPEKDLSACRFFQAADHIQRCAFSTAGGPQQPDQLPVRDLKSKVIDRDHIFLDLLVAIGISFRQILQYYLHQILRSAPVRVA